VIGFGTIYFAGPTSSTLQKINLNILYFEQTVTVFDFAVSHRYIVTAAHCIYMVNRATDVVAIVGTNNLVNRKLTEIILLT